MPPSQSGRHDALRRLVDEAALANWSHGIKSLDQIKAEMKAYADKRDVTLRFREDDDAVIIAHMDSCRYFVRAALGADVWEPGLNQEPESQEIISREGRPVGPRLVRIRRRGGQMKRVFNGAELWAIVDPCPEEH